MTFSAALRSVCLAAALCCLAAPVLADDMAVYMKNGFSRAVVVELRSTTRDKVWPGGDDIFLLDKAEKKSVPVTCEAGERICYGAWAYGDDSIAWGVGPDNASKCDDCCFTCVAKATETIEFLR